MEESVWSTTCAVSIRSRWKESPRTTLACFTLLGPFFSSHSPQRHFLKQVIDILKQSVQNCKAEWMDNGVALQMNMWEWACRLSASLIRRTNRVDQGSATPVHEVQWIKLLIHLLSIQSISPEFYLWHDYLTQVCWSIGTAKNCRTLDWTQDWSWWPLV